MLHSAFVWPDKTGHQLQHRGMSEWQLRYTGMGTKAAALSESCKSCRERLFHGIHLKTSCDCAVDGSFDFLRMWRRRLNGTRWQQPEFNAASAGRCNLQC
jgi:hypothetical protein